MTKLSRAAVTEAEECLRQAMLRSDLIILDELIAPELMFTNHLGQLITKPDDLALHRSGALKLQSLDCHEQNIRVYDGFAVVTVLMHLVGSFEEGPVDAYVRYTRVWASLDNRHLQIIVGHAGIADLALAA